MIYLYTWYMYTYMIYIYTYIHLFTYLHMHIIKNIHIQVHLHTCMHLLVHEHHNTCIYIYVCVCIYFHMQGKHASLFDLQLAFVGKIVLDERACTVRVGQPSYPWSQLWKTSGRYSHPHESAIYIYLLCDSILIHEHAHNIIQSMIITQCLAWTFARSFWILEFAFMALAVCKCSSIWEALVQGKKNNPNFQNFSMEIHGPRSQKVAGNACPWCWRRSDGVLPAMGSLVSTIFQGWGLGLFRLINKPINN